MSHYSVPGGSNPEPTKQAERPSSKGDYYLPVGLPMPLAEPGALFGPYWEGTRNEILRVQRNPETGTYQWPPQWIAYDTQTFDLEWVDVEPRGLIYSWTRVWHPIHPAMKDAVPYLVVVIELPQAGGVRMLGNLLGDPLQNVKIGSEVEAVFEHHNDVELPFTLVQWRTTG